LIFDLGKSPDEEESMASGEIRDAGRIYASSWMEQYLDFPGIMASVGR